MNFEKSTKKSFDLKENCTNICKNIYSSIYRTFHICLYFQKFSENKSSKSSVQSFRGHVNDISDFFRNLHDDETVKNGEKK